jgi:hypothetical protein
MGGYTPFDPGFGGFQFEDPMEEERRRRELEAQEATQLRQAMDTEPSWDDPVQDVSGRLPNVEPKKSTEGSIDDTASVAQAAAEGDVDYITRFEEHLANRPEREDYEPGTLRKILSVIGGTLAGGDPNVTRQLSGYGGYDEEMANWEREGQGLADVAELEETRYGEGTKRRGQDVTARGQDVTARGQDIRAGTEAAGQEISRGNLGLRGEELAEKQRAAGVSEPIEERKVEATESQAATAAERAGHYGRSVDALAGYRSRPSSPQKINLTQQAQLEKLALDDVLAINPEWEKFARFHETTGDVLGRAGQVPGTDEGFMWFDKPGPAVDDPDYQEFMLAFEAARRRRGGTAGLEDIPPLPQE